MTLKKSLLPVGIFIAFILLAAAPLGGVTTFLSAVHVRDAVATGTPIFLADQTGEGVVAEFRDSATPLARVLNGGGVEVTAPTAIATGVPALVVNSNGVSNLFEVRDGATPVFWVANGGAVSQSGGQTNNSNLVVSAPTAIGTATPAVLIDNAGVSNLLEIRDGATPAVQVFNGGGSQFVAPTAIATGVPAFVVDSSGVSNLFEVRDGATPVFTIQNGGSLVIPNGSLANRSLFLRYQDVAAAPTIRTGAGVVSTTTSITTSILGIDTPRNVVISWQTVTTATTGTITVSGVDARGSSTTDLISVGAVSGTQTLVGVVPWVSITSFALPVRTEAVTLTVTGGQRFGLPIIPAAAGNLYHLTVNATPQTAPTVNATVGTFDPVSTPAANVDYNVWIKQ